MAIDVRSDPPGRSAGGLYRNGGNGVPLGSMLNQMLSSGKTVISQERSRWQFNRSMYRGQQYIRATGSTVRSLAPSHRLPSGKRRDVVNRSRTFIDGRAAMLAMRTPMFEVPAERNTRQSYQSAKLAERILNFYWAEIDLSAKIRAMIRTGDVDGVAVLAVYFDPDKGEQISLPFSQDGRPIADPGVLEAMDDQGISTWQEMSRIGDVCVRNVPIGRLSIDPLARESFTEARWIIETRVRPRADVEREAGMTIDQILKLAGAGGTAARYPYASPQPDTSRLSIDEFDEIETTVSGREFVKTHTAFIRSTGSAGEWPDGAHISWIDQAPNMPLVAEKWEGALPYVFYVPRPDDGHFLRAKGIMDDLAPLNIALNRAVSQYHEMLDLYARAPVIAQRGSLVSKHIYNERRIVEYNAGYQPPQWMRPPPEPTRLLENIEFLLSQMAEIAIQNDVARGTPPGQGIDAGVSLHYLGQQNEQQMAGLESAVKRAVEETCTMILRNICRYFTAPRLLSIPGVYGVEQVNNFTGQMLRGCNRVRVIGSLLPRNHAAQMQTLIQLGSNGMFDVRPYIAQLTEGRMEEIVTDLERHERDQRNENRDLDLLGSIPNIDEIWQQFQQMRFEHSQMLTEFQQAFAMQEQAMLEQGMDPTGLQELMPQLPPAPTLANVGIEVPSPNEWNDDAIHMAELDRRRTEEGYTNMHPLVRQAYHEHAEMHKRSLAANMEALRPQPADPGMADRMVEDMGRQTMASDQEAAGNASPGSASAAGGAGEHEAPAPQTPSVEEPLEMEDELEDEGELEAPESMEPGPVQPPPQTIVIPATPPEVTVEAAKVEIPAPVVNVAPPVVNVPAPVVNVAPADVTVNIPKRGEAKVEFIYDENGKPIGARISESDSKAK